MLNVHKTIIAGAVTADCQTKEFDKRKVINYSVAVNESFKNSDGEKQELVTYYTIAHWVSLDSKLDEYIKKGTPVYIEGRMRTESSEKDGVKRTFWTLNVDEFKFTSTENKSA